MASNNNNNEKHFKELLQFLSCCTMSGLKEEQIPMLLVNSGAAQLAHQSSGTQQQQPYQLHARRAAVIQLDEPILTSVEQPKMLVEAAASEHEQHQQQYHHQITEPPLAQSDHCLTSTGPESQANSLSPIAQHQLAVTGSNSTDANHSGSATAGEQLTQPDDLRAVIQNSTTLPGVNGVESRSASPVDGANAKSSATSKNV